MFRNYIMAGCMAAVPSSTLFRNAPGSSTSCHSCRSVPFQNLADHVIYFLAGQLGKHRQRDAARGIALGVGYRARDPGLFSPRISFLLMDRNRVMALGVDTLCV